MSKFKHFKRMPTTRKTTNISPNQPTITQLFHKKRKSDESSPSKKRFCPNSYSVDVDLPAGETCKLTSANSLYVDVDLSAGETCNIRSANSLYVDVDLSAEETCNITSANSRTIKDVDLNSSSSTAANIPLTPSIHTELNTSEISNISTPVNHSKISDTTPFFSPSGIRISSPAKSKKCPSITHPTEILNISTPINHQTAKNNTPFVLHGAIHLDGCDNVKKTACLINDIKKYSTPCDVELVNLVTPKSSMKSSDHIADSSNKYTDNKPEILNISSPINHQTAKNNTPFVSPGGIHLDGCNNVKKTACLINDIKKSSTPCDVELVNLVTPKSNTKSSDQIADSSNKYTDNKPETSNISSPINHQTAKNNTPFVLHGGIHLDGCNNVKKSACLINDIKKSFTPCDVELVNLVTPKSNTKSSDQIADSSNKYTDNKPEISNISTPINHQTANDNTPFVSPGGILLDDCDNVKKTVGLTKSSIPCGVELVDVVTPIINPKSSTDHNPILIADSPLKMFLPSYEDSCIDLLSDDENPEDGITPPPPMCNDNISDCCVIIDSPVKILPIDNHTVVNDSIAEFLDNESVTITSEDEEKLSNFIVYQQDQCNEEDKLTSNGVLLLAPPSISVKDSLNKNSDHTNISPEDKVNVKMLPRSLLKEDILPINDLSGKSCELNELKIEDESLYYTAESTVLSPNIKSGDKERFSDVQMRLDYESVPMSPIIFSSEEDERCIIGLSEIVDKILNVNRNTDSSNIQSSTITKKANNEVARKQKEFSGCVNLMGSHIENLLDNKSSEQKEGLAFNIQPVDDEIEAVLRSTMCTDTKQKNSSPAIKECGGRNAIKTIPTKGKKKKVQSVIKFPKSPNKYEHFNGQHTCNIEKVVKEEEARHAPKSRFGRQRKPKRFSSEFVTPNLWNKRETKPKVCSFNNYITDKISLNTDHTDNITSQVINSISMECDNTDKMITENLVVDKISSSHHVDKVSSETDPIILTSDTENNDKTERDNIIREDSNSGSKSDITFQQQRKSEINKSDIQSLLTPVEINTSLPEIFDIKLLDSDSCKTTKSLRSVKHCAVVMDKCAIVFCKRSDDSLEKKTEDPHYVTNSLKTPCDQAEILFKIPMFNFGTYIPSLKLVRFSCFV